MTAELISPKCPNCGSSLRKEDMINPCCQSCGSLLLLAEDGELVSLQSVAGRQDLEISNSRIKSDLQLVESEFYRSQHNLAEAKQKLNRPVEHYIENLSKPVKATPMQVPAFFSSFLKGFGKGLLANWVAGMVVGVVQSLLNQIFDLKHPFSELSFPKQCLGVFFIAAVIVLLVAIYTYFVSKELRPWLDARRHNKTIETRFSAAVVAFNAALGPALKRAMEVKHDTDERLKGEIAALDHRCKGLDYERSRIRGVLDVRSRSGR